MLTFNLKKEWFEKIKSGEKTHEYREVKGYWNKRLFNYWYSYRYKQPFKDDGVICFTCGYPPRDDKNRRVYGQIISIKRIDGRNTDLKIPVLVYDIEFELLEEQ